MNNIPSFSFYSDVCKLVTIVVAVCNFFMVAVFTYDLIFGPREGLVGLAILWAIGMTIVNFTSKRGWPKIYAEQLQKKQEKKTQKAS